MEVKKKVKVMYAFSQAAAIYVDINGWEALIKGHVKQGLEIIINDPEQMDLYKKYLTTIDNNFIISY